ncbi:hypothetical protein ABW09_07210 [Pluralibacter gergoviae]|nr:hypothetical protein ABW07_13635 [Pluralibacter gergoviae]KMK19163.1 hypothetical protein ABW09_07210 [Pluralibacter gergoviae]
MVILMLIKGLTQENMFILMVRPMSGGDALQMVLSGEMDLVKFFTVRMACGKRAQEQAGSVMPMDVI